MLKTKVVTVVGSVTSLLLMLPAASFAEPGKPPSVTEVKQAQAAVATAKLKVSKLQTQLAQTARQTHQLVVQAEQAAENFNYARVNLVAAKATANKTAAASRKANRIADQQRKQVTALLLENYQNGSSLNLQISLLQQTGVRNAMVTYGAQLGATESSQTQYQEFLAIAAKANQANLASEQAMQTKLAAAESGQLARLNAAKLNQQAARRVAKLTVRREQLLRQLAKLQNISYRLAKRRQDALDQEALQNPEPAPETPQPSPVQPGSPTPKPTEPEPTTPKPTEPKPTEPEPTTPKPTTPKPTPTPPVDPTPPPVTDGVSKVIAFAKAQLGEPYVWGAEGPNSWDCSGLTSKAWGAAGVYLPHWSVGQYQASIPISRSQLQPGDLVFWGSSRSSSSIYHVAIYLGNDQYIHAPRTGKNVEIASMSYWAPNFFARVRR